MASPPPYTVDASASDVSSLKLSTSEIPPLESREYKFYIYSDRPKNIIAIFCKGGQFENSLLAERNYFDRTEYDIDFLISLGRLKLTFIVNTFSRQPGGRIISGYIISSVRNCEGVDILNCKVYSHSKGKYILNVVYTPPKPVEWKFLTKFITEALGYHIKEPFNIDSSFFS